MSIPTFSIPARQTCVGKTEMCSKYCYAFSSQVRFKLTLEKRIRNFKLSQTDEFISSIIEDISKIKNPYLRIHESGDFYSQEYINKWYKIIKSCPDKTFLAFTKSFQFDFKGKPKNLHLYASIWPDSDKDIKIPRNMKMAYTTVDNFKKFSDVKIDVKGAKKCKGHCDDCMMCFNGEGNVYFPIH